MSLEDLILGMAKDARQALRQLRGVEEGQKNAALELMAARLLDKQTDIVKENQKDLKSRLRSFKS